jgi:hypothetical protein
MLIQRARGIGSSIERGSSACSDVAADDTRHVMRGRLTQETKVYNLGNDTMMHCLAGNIPLRIIYPLYSMNAPLLHPCQDHHDGLVGGALELAHHLPGAYTRPPLSST